MSGILWKTKGSKPYQSPPLYNNLYNKLTNQCFDSTQVYNQQQNIEIIWIRASVIGLLFFL